MSTTEHQIQLQYRGFCNTPNLWHNNDVYGLKQFDSLQNNKQESYSAFTALPTRLGKRVELFALDQITKSPNTTLIARNIQVRSGKHTIGELDALLQLNDQPIHLEIIYKFYLYDPFVGTHKLEHWIGPNRNDSLIQKLDKLKNKQLPLLHRPETSSYLKMYQLKADEFHQYVMFKAQLFVPSTLNTHHYQRINTDCIRGHYYTIAQLTKLKSCQFFIPEKQNWLIEIPEFANWFDYKTFSAFIAVLLQQHRSPLIWIKHPDSTTERAFVVWW